MNKDVVNRSELEQLRKENEKLIILDVRDEEKYRAGSLQVDGLTPVNVPFVHMKEQDQPLQDQLAAACKDATIITVCTTGNKAQKAAALLRENGYRAVALEGGLTAWNSAEKQPE
ncbi:rhodanese-like domain-containing protein [Brevibacillus sp. GCM10020057]|uniref:rhodanese-like domain-containing protein n=1 Tax=Brevibacillus sp. GCM10020057 TaxID=3317327 RepID=UPI0036457366